MRWIRGRRRPTGVGRPEARPAFVFLALFALTLGFAACADEPTRPNARGREEGRTPPRPLGLVEITISGLGTGQVTSSALSAPTVAELERLRAVASGGAAGGLAPQDFELPAQTDGGGDGTIQLELLSTGSFTEGVRGSGGHRYLYATYRVRNAQKNGTPYDTPRKNLTFYAVSTITTLHHTPISKLLRFDGSDAAEELATQLIPTGAVAKDATTDSIFPINPDVFQALTEEEADAIGALAGEGIEDVFPYGFVVRRRGSTTTRELPANPEPEQFDGIVTFAYKVPLQATPADDPFTVSILFLAVDDDEVKITQSLEEQTPAGREAFEARAAALGADRVTVLAGRLFRAGNATRQICSLRTAGPTASPTRYLVNARPPTAISISPDPYALDGSASFIGRNAQLEVTADVPMEVVSQNAFSVRGTQSGPHFPGGSIDGDGTTRLTTSPAAFFPGEEVEVVIGQELVECPVHPPQVIRYRVATTGGPGSFVVDTTYTLVTVPIGYPTTPWSLALGDRDGDGHLDVVAAGPTSGCGGGFLVLARQNNGTGRFGTGSIYAQGICTGGDVRSVVLADLDGDGKMDDMVLTTAGSNFTGVDVAHFREHIGGFFGSRYSGSDPRSVALGDMNGDGSMDVVFAQGTSDRVTILLNQGDGSFSYWHSISDVGETPHVIALGDLDGDGDLDVLGVNEQSKDVSVLLNGGDGTLVLDERYGTPAAPKSVALGDLDRDGDLDAVVPTTSGVFVLVNDGTGKFAVENVLPSSVNHVALGDVDGDGDLDLVTASGSKTTVLSNDGGRNFSEASSFTTDGSVAALAMGDVDGDGALDLVAVHTSLFGANLTVALDR